MHSELLTTDQLSARASLEAREAIARQLGHTRTDKLFRVDSRFVPNLTRQDGAAIDRLLASRFATGQTPVAPTVATAPSGQAAKDATAPLVTPSSSPDRQGVPMP